MIALLLFFSSQAFAFPELSRHGYVHCTTCHLSPSGGGILTAYGRELSKEVLSTWAREGEQNPLWGLLPNDEKLLLGGFYRGVQVHKENPYVRQGRYISMQTDLEAAYTSEKLYASATVGRQEAPAGSKADDRILSRRHFIGFRATNEHGLRVGKFLKAHGVNDPNHIALVRKDLGFTQDTETYNIEYSYLGENFGGLATYMAGRYGDPSSYNDEKGYDASLYYFFLDHQKIGFSFFHGDKKGTSRNVFGPWWVVQPWEKIFIISELDFVQRPVKGVFLSKWGWVTTNKIGYEWIQGVAPFLALERARLDVNDPTSRHTVAGIGVQWYPRPHLEFNLVWNKEQDLKVGTYFSDLAYLMMHIYL